jgi:membrane protein
VASIIAIITLLVDVSGVFDEMQTTLNLIWQVPPRKTSLFNLARTRIASLGLVASLGFLLLVSLTAGAAISAVGDVIAPSFRSDRWHCIFCNLGFDLPA